LTAGVRRLLDLGGDVGAAGDDDERLVGEQRVEQFTWSCTR
jgi:hypothetical protein